MKRKLYYKVLHNGVFCGVTFEELANYVFSDDRDNINIAEFYDWFCVLEADNWKDMEEQINMAQKLLKKGERYVA